MKSFLTTILFSLFTTSLFATEVVDYVNPLVGSMSKKLLSTGNTYPAVALPWGMNFWTPQTGEMGDGWTYVYTADKIRGFKQTHQPSPWINDYGQFSLMPVIGYKIGQEERASWFSHKAEVATPYYYSVYLADHDITTELTPTERSAAFRFTFPESDSSYIVIDAFDNGSYIEVIPEKNTVIGYTTKNSGGVTPDFKNYFVIEFDTPFASSDVWSDSKVVPGKKELEANHVGAIIGFKTRRGQTVQAKVSSSFISFDQAWLNLKELGDGNFERIKKSGRDRWNDILGRIQVEGGSTDQYRTFYSCFYRSVLFPRKFYEINAQGEPVHYSPYEGGVKKGFLYTDTGFWDTFRALFPFLNLMYPSVNEEIQAGLANAYKESGFLPEWASPGHRFCMVGNNSASVVADAFLKGIGVEYSETLYDALLAATDKVHPDVPSTGRWGADYYNKLGYVPYDVKIPENVARTLEYAYDDWCIMQMAKKLGRPEKEIELFRNRSLNYKNVFDKSHNLMRGKNQDGSFQTPFNPYKWGDAFTEGNSWHYTWSVFHDVQGLIDLMGGKKTFVQMLDSVFVVPPIYDDSYYGFCIHEIKEMQIMNMGNYAHGNQPIQHMLYLYNYAGEPWKAQYWIREVMDRMYTAAPDGYCGDEDNGQTSAWYVFSAMGFYPVCPGTDQYVIGTPLFKKMTVTLENDKKIVLNAPDVTKENRYIKRIKLNGKEYTPTWFSYSRLKQGAVIDYEMSNVPNKKRGIDKKDFPYSLSNEK
ncbi:GH92 family glycosyl hydrolase [Coprobacter fastidiosus]|jgi:putative alpha-1,2-mannosidase|uniref:GH92 family glycosyl hydrolase n=1 Tax=Coprobacter fastidiosus TaxID=1099853 RepID=UPI00033AA903|nr:GH92 family glycosyl hydrolase [Coprobacter fastidiosus]CDD89406.1 putative uncharacterized protein [Tannerella sp. CAG:51]